MQSKAASTTLYPPPLFLNNIFLNDWKAPAVTAALVTMLTACGGGGTNTNNNNPPVDPNPPAPETVDLGNQNVTVATINIKNASQSAPLPAGAQGADVKVSFYSTNTLNDCNVTGGKVVMDALKTQGVEGTYECDVTISGKNAQGQAVTGSAKYQVVPAKFKSPPIPAAKPV